MITLRVTRYDGDPPVRCVSASFDVDGGTIGRANDSTLLLPDSGKRVSRLQARVSFDGRSFVIVDEGSNPGVLNGRPLARGRGARLSPGDCLVVGPYELVVEEAAASGSGAGLQSPASGVATDDPLELFGEATSSDPFSQHVGDLDKPLAGQPRPPRDQVPPLERQASSRAGRPQASTTPIPEDFDPFAPPPTETPPADLCFQRSECRSSLGIDLGPQRSLDEIYRLADDAKTDPFGLGHPLGSRPRSEAAIRSDLLPDWDRPAIATGGSNLPEVHEPMDLPRMVPDSPVTSPKAVREKRPQLEDVSDPLLLFPERPVRGETQAPPSRASSQRETLVEPTPRAPAMPAPGETTVMPVAPTEQKPAQASAGGSAEELLAAFLEGAGVPDLDLRTTAGPALMRLAGELLREATQGTYELLYARRKTKHELRVEHTTMAPKENNPLKFSPDAEAALRQLLSPPARGFMTSVSAMREGFDDLQAHHFGVIAGIRAALAKLLEGFDPAEIEKRLGHRRMLDSMLPVSRSARLWELFNERYQKLREDAEEDFHTVFGRAFVRAYEEQIERLRRKGKGEK